MVVSTATLAGIMSLLAELDADREIKTKEEIQEECFGDVYTREEFLEQVRSGRINCFDGIGYYHDGNEETEISVWTSEGAFVEISEFPYICWYNK